MMNVTLGRMKQLGAHFCVYVALYVTSIVINQIVTSYDPRGLYLLGWTTHNLYWFVWVPSLVFALCGADYWAWTITIGNLIGVVVGQVLGEYPDKDLVLVQVPSHLSLCVLTPDNRIFSDASTGMFDPGTNYYDHFKTAENVINIQWYK